MAANKQDVWVLLVEDSETDATLIVRQLRTSGLEPQCERVASEPSLRDALSKRPWDLVISDSIMPSFDAMAALGVTQTLRPGTPFIVVSGTMREETAVAALRSGAADYVTKDKLHRLGVAVNRELGRPRANGSLPALLAAIDHRLAYAEQQPEGFVGEIGSARVMLAQALAAARELEAAVTGEPVAPAHDEGVSADDGPLPPPRPDRTSNITARQLAVLELIAQGHSTREIAQRLELSVKTVESHRAQLLLRLGVRGVAGLVRHAIRIGLITVDD